MPPTETNIAAFDIGVKPKLYVDVAPSASVENDDNSELATNDVCSFHP
jgi:hypothetical protein